MARIDGRAPDELRKIVITPDYLSHPLASVLIRNGGTRVVCAVSIDAKVPAWMKNRKVPGGWITCEYGMLPASTHDRMKRESSAGKQGGRTVEIQRLIGRSLRMSADLLKLGENTAYLDWRRDRRRRRHPLRRHHRRGDRAGDRMPPGSRQRHFPGNPFKESVAAISVGVIGGVPMLDLCYEEDSNAEVDMNVVMTESGKLVEVQGTAEGEPFSRARLNELIDLAEHGLKQVFAMQREAVETALEVRP